MDERERERERERNSQKRRGTRDWSPHCSEVGIAARILTQVLTFMRAQVPRWAAYSKLITMRAPIVCGCPWILAYNAGSWSTYRIRAPGARWP
jgi:hypothetical protein